MANSTFTIGTITRKEKYTDESVRFALSARELLRNADSQLAKDIQIFNFEKLGTEYLCIAHNGKAFDDIGNLISCMRPNTTGGEGVQGSGMKAAMFLLTENWTQSELVIHSHKDANAITAKLTCVNLNDACIEDVSGDWNQYVNQSMRSHYNDYNVYYFLKCVNERTKNKKKNGNSICRDEYTQLLVEMCPEIFDRIKVKARYLYLISNHEPMDNTDQRRLKVIQNKNAFDRDFCVEQETFKVENIKVESSGITIDVDCNIEIKVYPNITDDASRSIVINDVMNDNNSYSKLGECVDDVTHSDQLLFVNCNFNINGCEKNLTRAYNDPYYCSSNVYSMLQKLGLYLRKADFSDKLKDYWPQLIDRFNESGKKSILKRWRPVVKVFMQFVPKTKLNCLSAFGNLNEFFYADDTQKVKDLINLSFDKLAYDKPDSLKNFIQKVKNQFPFDSAELAPLPTEEELVRNKEIINLRDNVTNNIIRLIKPGESRYVNLEFRNGEPVLDEVIATSKGITLNRQKDNFYYIHVTELSEIIDDVPRVISVEEYRHGPTCFPKKYNKCDVCGKAYKFGFDVDIPLRDSKNRTHTINHPFGSKSDTNMYQELPEGLLGSYVNGKLILNKCHPTIVKIASFNIEQHPSLYKKLCDIYRKATDIAAIANSNLFDIQVAFNPRSRNLNKLRNDSGDAPDKWFVNSYIDCYFKTSEVVELIEKIQLLTEVADMYSATIDTPDRVIDVSNNIVLS